MSAQVTGINPNNAYQGQNLHTVITSSALFITGSSPQGNIQDVIFKNSTDSVFAISDSTNVVTANTATTFWNIPGSIATGIYDLIVRIYNSITQTSTDYRLSNGFRIQTFAAAIDSVWPGDANSDHVVNNYDLFSIGLAYDSSGPSRAVSGNFWQADGAVAWAQYFSGFVNFKHADCNGDGIVNASDTSAILSNFSLIHHTFTLPRSSPFNPRIQVMPASDTVYNGDTLIVNFYLGDSTTYLHNFYALAFTYSFDPMVIDTNYFTISVDSSWMGGSTSKISITKAYPGLMYVAITRIDHQTIAGYGHFATASFKITTDNISGKDYSAYLNTGVIINSKVIDSAGNDFPVSEGGDSTIVMFVPNGIRNTTAVKLQVIPNPATGKVNIRAAEAITGLELYSINGLQVFSSGEINTKQMLLDISNYENGVYLIKVTTRHGAELRKLLVLH